MLYHIIAPIGANTIKLIMDVANSVDVDPMRFGERSEMRGI